MKRRGVGAQIDTTLPSEKATLKKSSLIKSKRSHPKMLDIMGFIM